MMSPAGEKPDAGIELSAYKGLFLEEAESFLAALRRSLKRLAREPEDDAALKEAHRAAHTLKGMASTMRYERLVALAGRLEAPLSPESPLTRDEIAGLLDDCDAFEVGLTRLEEDEGEGG